MPLTIEFLGHAGFLLSDGTHTLAIDPFLTDNPVAKKSADRIDCTHIAVTHGHADHYSDVPAIAKRTGATVYAAFEIANHLGEQGHERVEPMNPGGTVATPFGSITLTQAFHSSSFEGRYMGQPCGVVARIGRKTVYHLGDTALFGDLKLLGEMHTPDIAIVPVGDRFTMGKKDATAAADLIGAPTVIPCHYKTWPPLAQDLVGFKPQAEVVEMKPGETRTF
ncbi:MAG: metal-dependent hydrolase [Phycisphaerales bacterium JB040]